MSEVKTSFRASYGLDAAGEKVINVAKADKTVMTDGVNVEYLIQENTTQQYDPERAYEKGFIIEFNDRLWIAEQDISKPAGSFNEGYWRPVRTDPKWKPIDSGKYQLHVGDYISVDTRAGLDVELTLPTNPIPQEGDTIVVKDVGGQPGYTSVLVFAPVQSIIDKGVSIPQKRMTIPFSEWTFVYTKSQWSLYDGVEAPVARTVTTSGPTRIQSGDMILRNYDKVAPIVLTFPKFANNGDMIHFVGMNENTVPYYHLELNAFDNNTSIGSPGKSSQIFYRSLSGYFIFNSLTSTWYLYDSDMTNRLRTVSTDTEIFPNETVAVVGKDNTTTQSIKLTLPQNVQPGDQVTISLNYIRKGQTVNIVPKGTDMILTNQNLTQFPKRSSYPPAANWVNTNLLSYNGSNDYPPVLTFAYIDMGPIKQWLMVSCLPVLERVDPTTDDTRTRLGVIALANQSQANLDKENISVTANPLAREVAITPETLANRTALDNRRGIARIAKQGEVNLTTDDAALAYDTIVTPKTLNGKKATETMVGLAEIATQAETNSNTDDSRIITSKKLDGRRASPALAGVAKLVATGGTAPVKGGTNTRDTAGTGIYNHADFENIVTPKTLREYYSTEMALGTVYLANSAEVISGAATLAKYPLAVTPETLHTKTATDERIGFSQVAKQAEVDAGTDYFKFVTPKTLAGRIAREDLAGIAKLATQGEFDAGTAGLISGPDKIKTFFSRAERTIVNNAEGLTQSGSIWTGLKLNILAPSETQRGTARYATQDETDKGVDATTIVTPAKLHAKKATTVAEGIVRMANTAETVAGTAYNLAVSPGNLKYVVQSELSWEATPERRGFIKLSTDSTTWQGNTVDGNANINIETQFNKTGMAVSPYEFNRVLRNYLPIGAKAVDSDKLDGLDSSQFIRRDIGQIVNGALTLTQPTTATYITASNDVSVQALLSANQINVRKSGTPDDTSVTKNAGINLYGAPQSATGRPTYGIHFSSTGGTDPNGIHGYGSGTWGTYFAQNISSAAEQRAWYFQQIFNGAVKNVGSITAQGDVWFDGVINSDKTFRLKNSVIAEKDSGDNLIFGTPDQQMYLRSKAADIKVQEVVGGTSYQVITSKNFVDEGNKTYVRKTGDSMTGRLNISQPITATINQSAATPNAVPNASNFGTWTIDITDPAIYNTMRPYVVGVNAINKETGEVLPWFDKYEEFNGPGTLSQFGSSASNGSGTYQIWAPRPPADKANLPGHIAGTLWTRQWNPITNKWDGWGRVFTNNHPPLPTDIGAMSNNGSVFDSMRIRDWIQVGNLRIYADPSTKTVRFDWIE
ncbi:tail fiber protein proximal subunit [Acinetobacter phage vB_AbaM_AB-Navy-v2]